jgi:hypothetical protein
MITNKKGHPINEDPDHFLTAFLILTFLLVCIVCVFMLLELIKMCWYFYNQGHLVAGIIGLILKN